MSTDAASGKILKQSRDRVINALADAYQTNKTRAEFRKVAAEIIDHYNSETRELCLQMKNYRTGEIVNQRIDVKGLILDNGNVDQITRWGAWLYAKGWEASEFTSTVKLTKSEHPGEFYHVMMGKPVKKT